MATAVEISKRLLIDFPGQDESMDNREEAIRSFLDVKKKRMEERVRILRRALADCLLTLDALRDENKLIQQNGPFIERRNPRFG